MSCSQKVNDHKYGRRYSVLYSVLLKSKTKKEKEKEGFTPCKFC